MPKIRCLQPVIYIFLVLWTMVVWSSCSCEKDNQKAGSPATAALPVRDSTPIKEPPAEIHPKEIPGQLVISPSADTGAKLYTSWPLIISAHFWRKIPIPEDQKTLPSPITLSSKKGSWREALVLEVKNSSGNGVFWPFHPITHSDTALALGVNDSATAHWWLDPSETHDLPEGVYNVTVKFNPELMEGLPDFIARDRFYLSIVKEPAPLNFAQGSAKQYQMAMVALIKGDIQAAYSQVDTLLAAEPENIGALALKARLLANDAKYTEAESIVEKALTVYNQSYPDGDPPLGLLYQRSEILKKSAQDLVEEKTSRLPE